MGWTFTLGYFSWVAFLYIGVRARQRRWVLWGVLYFLPFAYELAARASTAVWPREWDHGWEGLVVTLLYLVVMAVSIFHALRVRKEYLVRLDSLMRSQSAMFATSKGRDWRLRHSLWIAWTFAFGFFSWLAFLYAGARTQRLRWKLWGLAYAVPPTLVLLIPDNTAGTGNSWFINFLISVTVGLGFVSIIHAFLIRSEYLLRLEMMQQESSNVSVTSQGKRWEFLQSLWILGTFTAGFFSWLSFLYIGIRAKRARWVLWSLFYFAFPLGFAIVANVAGPESQWMTPGVAILLIVMVASVSHAFMVRKDYLTRLEERLQESIGPDAALRRRLEREYELGDEHTTSTHDPASKVQTMPEESVGSEDQETLDDPQPPRSVSEPTPKLSGNRTVSSSEPEEQTTTDSISQSYPLPVAYGWSLIASLWDPRDRYREQLRLAENLLAFLGSTSLALVREQDSLDEKFDLKLYWQGGISPGHWRLIIQHATKALPRDRQNPLAQQFRALNVGSEKKGIGPDVGALIRAKNDYKHDRGPMTEQHLIEASSELHERIERCIRALSFFKEYPMRLVQDFDVDRHENNFVLKCLRLVGDGPGFPQERLVHPRALPRGDVFLDIGDQVWVPLHPFIVATNCPRCLYRETYFVDRWDDRKGLALMKSFERGHTAEDEQVASELVSLVAEHHELSK